MLVTGIQLFGVRRSLAIFLGGWWLIVIEALPRGRNGKDGAYANTYTGQVLETRADLSSHANFHSSNHGHFHPLQAQSKNSSLPTTTTLGVFHKAHRRHTPHPGCARFCVCGAGDVVQREGCDGWRVEARVESCRGMVPPFVCKRVVTQCVSDMSF